MLKSLCPYTQRYVDGGTQSSNSSLSPILHKKQGGMAGEEMRQMSDGRKFALNFGTLIVLLACVGFWIGIGTLALKWLGPH